MRWRKKRRKYVLTVYRLQYWALSLLVFPVLTLFGNLLVCVSVYIERTLHTVTNYFIVSLAVADIMVAILVMPLAVYVEVWNAPNLHVCCMHELQDASLVRVLSHDIRQNRLSHRDHAHSQHLSVYC